jgi:hypothetical protein
MVNPTAEFRRCCGILLLAAVVLTVATWSRSAEYDEQYTLFLTAGMPRPVWPETAFAAGAVQSMQGGQASLATIAVELRRTDVHPPLYFWSIRIWRDVAGSSLLAARLLSAGFSLATMAVIGLIARQAGVPSALAMTLTLSCYGFVYTGCIARGFALALLLIVGGVACALAIRGRRWVAMSAGALFGAATAANYLAVFVPVGLALAVGAVQVMRAGAVPSYPARRGEVLPPLSACKASSGASQAGSAEMLLPALAGFLPFIALDLWFFIAQRNARTGQFPPFHMLASLQRLAHYTGANLFGGLPLYVPDRLQTPVTMVLAAMLAGLAALVIGRWRHIGDRAVNFYIGTAALAPPTGLLALGLLFNNTPIELRYLSFATPFIALLLAGALAALPRVIPALLLAVQAMAIVGLVLRPETMQPARATAQAAAALVDDGVVLLPYGNDGVGIVGAFAAEAPPALRLLVFRPDEPAAGILQRLAGYRRVVLAELAQDASSRDTIPKLRAVLTASCWRRVAEGFNVVAYDRVCAAE